MKHGAFCGTQQVLGVNANLPRYRRRCALHVRSEGGTHISCMHTNVTWRVAGLPHHGSRLRIIPRFAQQERSAPETRHWAYKNRAQQEDYVCGWQRKRNPTAVVEQQNTTARRSSLACSRSVIPPGGTQRSTTNALVRTTSVSEKYSTTLYMMDVPTTGSPRTSKPVHDFGIHVHLHVSSM